MLNDLGDYLRGVFTQGINVVFTLFDVLGIVLFFFPHLAEQVVKDYGLIRSIGTGIMILSFAAANFILFRKGNVPRLADERERHREQDRAALERFKSILLENRFGVPNIQYIRDQDFGGVYRVDIHSVMDRFHQSCLDPQNFFLDKQLREIQVDLCRTMDEFNQLLAHHSVAIPNPELAASWHRIAQAYRYELPNQYGHYTDEDYQKVSLQLNQMATRIWETYTKLITIAKHAL